MIVMEKRIETGKIDPTKCGEMFDCLGKDICKEVCKDFFDLPSDTGRVALRKDLALIAAIDIDENTTITRMAFTTLACVIPNGREIQFWGEVGCVPVKKFIPFSGLGSFAKKVSPDKSNCILICDSSGEFHLQSTRKIFSGEEILFTAESSGTSFIKFVSSREEIFNDLAELIKQQKLQTRSETEKDSEITMHLSTDDTENEIHPPTKI